MKTWKISIEAETEFKACEYLKMLVTAFEIAYKHDLPMDAMFLENPGTKQKLDCKRIIKV